jgi:hypothetical protein
MTLLGTVTHDILGIVENLNAQLDASAEFSFLA